MARIVFPEPGERIPYRRLDQAERERIHGWLIDHDIDYTRVPVHADLRYDDATGEWRIPLYVRKPGGIVVDPVTGEPRRVVVRRRELRPLPWPTYGPPVVMLDGVDISGYLLGGGRG